MFSANFEWIFIFVPIVRLHKTRALVIIIIAINTTSFLIRVICFFFRCKSSALFVHDNKSSEEITLCDKKVVVMNGGTKTPTQQKSSNEKERKKEKNNLEKSKIYRLAATARISNRNFICLHAQNLLLKNKEPRKEAKKRDRDKDNERRKSLLEKSVAAYHLRALTKHNRKKKEKT